MEQNNANANVNLDEIDFQFTDDDNDVFGIGPLLPNPSTVHTLSIQHMNEYGNAIEQNQTQQNLLQNEYGNAIEQNRVEAQNAVITSENQQPSRVLLDEGIPLIRVNQETAEVYPRTPKCSVCSDARQKCSAECMFKNTVSQEKYHLYKKAEYYYTKNNLKKLLKEFPEDKWGLFMEYRFEEGVNLDADRLGGSAKIIRDMKQRIAELEEDIRRKDAIILNYQNERSNLSVSVGPAAASATIPAASLPAYTVSETNNQYPQHQVPTRYPTPPQLPYQHQQLHFMSDPRPNQLAQQLQLERYPQHQVPYLTHQSTTNRPQQAHQVFNQPQQTHQFIHQPQQTHQFIHQPQQTHQQQSTTNQPQQAYQFTHQPQQAHQFTYQSQQAHQFPNQRQQFSQQQVRSPNPRYWNPTQHQYHH